MQTTAPTSLKALVAAACLALLPAAHADVLFGTSGGTVSITLTAPISFTATGTETQFLRFVFEDLYASAPNSSFFATLSNSIGVLRNGVPIEGLSTTSLWGPLGTTLGEIDPNDFTLSFTGANGILVGDTITLTTGTAVTNVPASFVPTLAASVAVMTGNSGNAISGVVSVVPEPASVALMLLGLGAVGVAARRRA